MPMGRMPSPVHAVNHGLVRSRLGAWPRAVLVVSALAGLAALSCQKDKILKPGSVPSNILTAVYVPADVFRSHSIAMDGVAKEVEWGGPADLERPFTMIRMTAENGAGNPGPPMYVSAKAVYTDTDFFMMLQWADPEENAMKDVMFYTGPTLAGTNEQDEPVLQDANNWVRGRDATGAVYDEDRIYLAFEIKPSGDDRGTYQAQGCQMGRFCRRKADTSS